MNRRLVFVVSLLSLVLVCVIFFSRRAPRRQSVEEVAQPTTEVLRDTNALQRASSNIKALAPAVVQAYQSNKASQERQRQWQQAIEAKNRPVNFYGMVVDERGNPLDGARIKVYLRHNSYSTTEKNSSDYPHNEISTDATGRFQWVDSSSTGDVLIVETITKANYEMEPNALRSYAPGSGSIDRPVTFRMWPTNLHEQLITGTRQFSIVPDGAPYFIALSSGTISQVSGGDLKIWVKYAAATPGQLSDWSAGISVLGGGLLEETNSYEPMFSAPTEGYTNDFLLNQQIKGGQSGSTGSRRFYVLWNNKQDYGRMSIELYAPYGRQTPGLVRIQYSVNPSGSTVLR